MNVDSLLSDLPSWTHTLSIHRFLHSLPTLRLGFSLAWKSKSYLHLKMYNIKDKKQLIVIHTFNSLLKELSEFIIGKFKNWLTACKEWWVVELDQLQISNITPVLVFSLKNIIFRQIFWFTPTNKAVSFSILRTLPISVNLKVSGSSSIPWERIACRTSILKVSSAITILNVIEWYHPGTQRCFSSIISPNSGCWDVPLAT